MLHCSQAWHIPSQTKCDVLPRPPLHCLSALFNSALRSLLVHWRRGQKFTVRQMKFLLTSKLRSGDDDWRRECDEECEMRNVSVLYFSYSLSSAVRGHTGSDKLQDVEKRNGNEISQNWYLTNLWTSDQVSKYTCIRNITAGQILLISIYWTY